MKAETELKIHVRGRARALPVRHGFACFPSDHLPNEIWDKGRDFDLVVTEHFYFYAVGITRTWQIIRARSQCDSVSSGRGLGRALFGRGKNARVGLVHDWLYSLSSPAYITRRQADEILYRAARYGGCPAWRARAAWLAVRACGWLAYKKELMGDRQPAE